MPAPYASYRDRAVRAVDRVHAERVRIIPQHRGNYAAGPDPSRPAADLPGPLRIGASENDGGGARRNFTSTIPVGRAELHLDRALLPEGFVVRQGDLVIALDRPGEPRFEVLKPEPDHVARLVLKLGAVGAA